MKASFHGFPDKPGDYLAVKDVPDYDDQGELRQPYLYSPYNGTYLVSVMSDLSVSKILWLTS